MRILTIGMGNLNRRRAIGAARAAVRDDGGCLSRAARKRFTAGGLVAGTNERPLCLPVRMSPDRAFASMSPMGIWRRLPMSAFVSLLGAIMSAFTSAFGGKARCFAAARLAVS